MHLPARAVVPLPLPVPVLVLALAPAHVGARRPAQAPTTTACLRTVVLDPPRLALQPTNSPHLALEILDALTKEHGAARRR